jgi:hypothetical protein
MGIFVQDSDAKARLTRATPLGFRAMPYTVLISPGGEITRRFVGAVSEADLVAAIESARQAR